jgi:hypothetical protein
VVVEIDSVVVPGRFMEDGDIGEHAEPEAVSEGTVAEIEIV